MAGIQDMLVSAALNLLSALAFLMAFAILRLQPVNDRVYFPKWYIKGIRGSPARYGVRVNKFVNMNWRTYMKFWTWMPAALQMPEPEVIDHAGLDSAVYVRIYILGLKIFVPVTVLSLVVLVPINVTARGLANLVDVKFSHVDKLSISNIEQGSNRYWAHLVMSYGFLFWTTYVLYNEYKTVATMRLLFLACEKRRADQFTVLVRNVPPDPDESISEHVEHFFCVNHPDHYLIHKVVYDANKLAALVSEKKSVQNWLTYYQNKYDRRSNAGKRPMTRTGFCGFWGTRVDAIEHFSSEIERLSSEEREEREKVIADATSIIPAAFVSFKTRWGAAVCAQTQQSSNPTLWLTEWAPEPRDVYWSNLAIPYVELSIRRFLMGTAMFFLAFFFIFPIAFVQSLANIDDIKKHFPFLRPLIKIDKIKSVIQGFLPGIALKLFLLALPVILMMMSKIEGFPSISSLERRSTSKYHLFILVNVFFGSIITGTVFEQFEQYSHFADAPLEKFMVMIGETIPMKATFFITYIMVDGWSSIAAEILRLVPLALFHLKNTFLVKTEHDREQAMDPGSLNFPVYEPRIQFFFLLGFVYAVVTPILLPFILVFFAFSYLVFRHQIINVYDQKYESGAAFWPDVQRRIIIGMIISQVLLLGLLSTKGAHYTTPTLAIQPLYTIWFYQFCKGRFELAFIRFPLQDAMVKDTLEKAKEPYLNLRAYLHDAYVHPVFKGEEELSLDRPEIEDIEEGDNCELVPTKRSCRSSKPASDSEVIAAS